MSKEEVKQLITHRDGIESQLTELRDILKAVSCFSIELHILHF